MSGSAVNIAAAAAGAARLCEGCTHTPLTRLPLKLVTRH